ncbi:MAG: hypothetical protein HKO53_09050 [Gemmatimonadetes bacterium]|nr:hypothetical protein [Gemmatimonadota bacterium]NNM33201.1 hypothetical protein [Gemmatimonadota bacterium]
MSDVEPHGTGPETPDRDDDIPWGQRFFDSPFILLFLCIVVMFVFYTGWGLWEILSLEPAPLP